MNMKMNKALLAVAFMALTLGLVVAPLVEAPLGAQAPRPAGPEAGAAPCTLPGDCPSESKSSPRRDEPHRQPASLVRKASGVAAQGTGGPDGFGYTWDDGVSYSWVEATNGTDTGLAGDDQASPAPSISALASASTRTPTTSSTSTPMGW